jgi:Domain of unknown function (DUF5680)
MSPSLAQFLSKAKLATYAAQGDFASVEPLLPSTKQLEFDADGYSYRDVYAGMIFFVGQEIVYRSKKAVWSMSYSGGLTVNASEAAVAEIYKFLRVALREVPPDLPLRGPSSVQSGQLGYSCEVQGDLERFSGIEQVTIASSPVYELRFSGGVLR